MTYQTKRQLRETLGCTQDVVQRLQAQARATDTEIALLRGRTIASVLRTVLEALDIPGYKWTNQSSIIAKKNPYDTTRFLKDLETAIAVRQAKKQADADAATERKVAGLVKKGETVQFYFTEPRQDKTSGTYTLNFVPFGDKPAPAASPTPPAPPSRPKKKGKKS